MRCIRNITIGRDSSNAIPIIRTYSAASSLSILNLFLFLVVFIDPACRRVI